MKVNENWEEKNYDVSSTVKGMWTEPDCWLTVRKDPTTLTVRAWEPGTKWLTAPSAARWRKWKRSRACLIKLSGGATRPRSSAVLISPLQAALSGAGTHHPRTTLTDMRGESFREVVSAASRLISYAWPANAAFSKSTNCEVKRGARPCSYFFPSIYF